MQSLTTRNPMLSLSWAGIPANSPGYILSMMSYDIKYPIWLVWVSCPDCVLSQPLVKINSVPAETRTGGVGEVLS